ncbi:uncharacterized protein BDR25DRAFT_239204 [Lindgomyces ingoldianus]|uniref:Uncharacterized protein n=1 Tax=Lindgomyces ingoldianus TaxID=673940 RepID=A0ACB6QGH4_9PLEO|nr:uncharacterized protein BDR25DRAFT_239204 [Lindgomyces ingoldianus]KAF2465462.1 hypothetical protein BDR25DRAFT_239204 [Lindgomyces ingoldianus]
MKIQSLLNPFCGDHQGYRSSASPAPVTMPRPVITNTPTPRRQKIPKDAPIFAEGAKVVGMVNFPPYETEDDESLASHQRRFQMYPMGQVGKYPRHIPYNSEKKDFMEKTGREAFEVFQYTFKIPGEERMYSVLWDYNIGLVRITPFFKCCKYPKTTPAKVLNMNPGLRDISHSITGGALAAQGYWMPYKAAKAVAATFCYNIRHALTPVFGKDFLSMCTPPKSPNFGRFLIDPAIIRECTADTKKWLIGDDRCFIPTPEKNSSMSTLKEDFACPPQRGKSPRSHRTKHADQESGYGTDTDQSDKYFFSPQVSPRSQAWTSVNRPQSPISPSRIVNRLQSPTSLSIAHFSSSQPWLSSVPRYFNDDQLRTKRTLSKVEYNSDSNTNEDIPPTGPSAETGSDFDSDRGDGVHTKKELDAAEIILQLKAADTTLHRTKRARRGSRY